jgi:hypothetical protein
VVTGQNPDKQYLINGIAVLAVQATGTVNLADDLHSPEAQAMRRLDRHLDYVSPVPGRI